VKKIEHIELGVESLSRLNMRQGDSIKNLLQENTALAIENLFLKSIIAIASVAVIIALCVVGFVS